jgi:hypothetical protein
MPAEMSARLAAAPVDPAQPRVGASQVAELFGVVPQTIRELGRRRELRLRIDGRA